MSQLLAFESAARHSSVSLAAQELNLTQGAISRQIAALEDQLGTALFDRVRQRLMLTDAGRLYATELRTGLDAVSNATHRVMTIGGPAEVLNVATLPTFGTRWLVPRLPRFIEQYPEVTVNIAIRTESFDFVREPLDVAIHHGVDFWPGGVCRALLEESVLPVCSPEFKRRCKIRQPSDMIGQRLLHQSTRPTQWADWFEHSGISAPQAMHGPRFELFSMLAQAAAGGMGIALVPRFFVEEELEAGRLIVLFDNALNTERAYYVVVAESGSTNRLAPVFRDWLLSEAATA